ncbi:hypothetical protein EPA93_20900 [Ktedonosporobacter rubrisoli]|uniref:General stress protein 17M-like domain-containing protein n=1 Tax=Ktedonosporobacter rubrisoli TaxID=2509675 RepID=A0A4P6JSR9_KTERU|nr:hypothetical protein [Ktedonosporobacter rubrisoli]QBD78323.1 hypothetical protein EPA93_20900 [Ktedonosporobacter rubrisoli]
MAMTQSDIVLGVFPEYDAAKQALDDLKRAGFNDDEVGFLARSKQANTPPDALATNTATGAVGGGVAGGIVGAAAALLIPGFGPAIAGGIIAASLGSAAVGAAAGAFAGGLTGVFKGIGISEGDAQFYRRALDAGHTIVTVKASHGLDEAIGILRRDGATDVKKERGAINASPPLRPFGASPETYDSPQNP